MPAYFYCPFSTLCRLFLAACMLLLTFGAAQANPVSLTLNSTSRASNYAAPPNWSINPADFQFSMSMVIRLRYDQVPANNAGSMVAVYVGQELRGFATGSNIGGSYYYFLTVYSNQYTGEALSFQAYYSVDDKVYATQESIGFTHFNVTGSIGMPFWINIDPNADFAPELMPFEPDTTLQNIPFDPVNLADKLFSLDGDPVTWSVQAGPNLMASITNGILTVSPVSPAWTGTETLTITATENTPNHYFATAVAQFTVLPDYGPPVFQTIPAQAVYAGNPFPDFDLDDHLTFSGPCRAFGFEVFPFSGAAPDPNWPVIAPGAQSMKIVARPMFADIQLAGAGAQLAAFVGGNLVGTASPVGNPPVVTYTLFLENTGSGPVTFKYYDPAKQFLHEKTTALNFVPGGTTGTVAVPYEIQFSPLLPNLASDGTVQVNIVDTSWRGSFPINFMVWDCNFPVQRRDTATVSFSVLTDDRPRLISAATVSFQENACYALYDAQAIDPNDSEGNGLVFSIVGGADAAKFSIDPNTGVLTWFNFNPDFENPGDSNADNQYELNIQVINTLNQTDLLSLVVSVTEDVDGLFNPQLTGTCIVNGSAVLTATGGSTYLWSTGAVTASINVNTPGTYTVTITDVAACSAVLSRDANAAPTITVVGNAGLICAGTDIALTSSPAGGSGVYTGFSWMGPNNFSSTLEDPTPFAATPQAGGTYTVTVTDDTGCSATASTTLNVSANSAPTITATGTSPVCSGKNISLGSTPSGGSGTYTLYKWAGPNNYTANAKNPVAFIASVAASGAYTVTVTDNQGCSATGTVAVLVHPVPSLAVTGNSPVCVGKTIQLGSAPSGGSGTYTSFAWAGPNGFNETVEDPAGFAATLPASGTYTVTVTDNAGCTAINTVAISVNGVPSISAMASGPTCLGGNLTLVSTPVGGSGNYTTYSWLGPNNFTATVEDPAPFAAIPAAAGTYSVTVTDNSGCSATASTTLAVHAVPGVSAQSNSPVCQGASLLLSSAASGGSGVYSTFNWTGPDNYVASAKDPVGFSTTLTSAGIYEVKVTDNLGCTATATTTVVVIPKPTVTVSNNGPVCQGTFVNLKSNPASGSGVFTGFSWTGPGVYTSNVQNPPGFAATLALAGIYRVTVTDNVGCTATASTSLAVSSLVAPMVTATSNSPLCAGKNLNLQAGATGGSGVYTTYAWAGPNNFTASVAAPTPFPASPLAAGTYTVTVTDNQGCFNTSTASVEVANVVATATSNVNGCILSGDILLMSSATGGSGVYIAYAWSGPNNYMASVQNPPGFPAIAAASGVYTVTVTDNTGCTGTGTLSIVVGDNIPPTITCPANITLAANGTCMGTVGDRVSLATNVTDNCTAPGNITVTQMPVASTVLSGHNDFETVTLTADDGNGNTTPCSFTVTLKDVTIPVITCPADQTVDAGSACAGVVGNRVGQEVSLSDNCTASGNIAVTQMPAASTPLTGHNDARTVTLTANDGNGNTANCMFQVTLKDVSPPTINCPADFTVAADQVCTAPVGDGTLLVSNVTDNCTAPAAIALSQMPAANTLLSGHNDFRIVTVTANDGNGNSASCNYKITLKDISPPTFTCPPDQTVAANNFCYNFVGDLWTIVTDLADNCTATNDIVKTQIPDPSTVLFMHNDFELVTLAADDGHGNIQPCNFKITLKDVTPPTIICPGPLLRGCANTVPPPNISLVSAFDNCGSVTVSHLNDSAPYEQTCANRFKITRTYQAIDPAGNTANCTRVITVNDVQTPYFTSSPPNTSVQCHAVPAVGTPVAADGCGAGVVITYLGENRTNGSCLDNYTLTRIWLATDACGNSRTVSQRITVFDTQKPVFTSIPGNVTIACTDALPAVGTPVATDNCDNDVLITYYGQWNMNSTCPGTYQILRYWQASDNCGNAAYASQFITIQDNQAPVFTSVPPPVTVQCSAPLPPIGTPTASDACGSGAQVTFLGEVRTDGSCLYNFTITRTWRAQDLCGNAVTTSQIITVHDTQAPNFNNPPANVVVTCAQIPNVPVLTATDNCGPAPVTYLGQTAGPGDCSTGYTLTRQWSAVDLCGNVKTHTQTIVVIPQFDPGAVDRKDAETASQRDFRLVPNPAGDWVRLELDDFKGEQVIVSLFTTQGALVWEQKFEVLPESPVLVNLQKIGAGIYLVGVRDAEGASKFKRLVRSRK